ncbi:MAG: DUF805 domain-containing protein [Asticcacaulis sp.]|uniref:DUF805 domain-containing protein n=1 Tax=Asticcacaulis sp. TaxID=1872648 RepID=UPI0039E33901
MINLSWNTQGRIALKDYRKERWRHFFFCLIPVGLFIAGTVAAVSIDPLVGAGAYIIGAIVLLYYRYRFLQVMIRRLHDVNMSGKLLIMSPVVMLIVLAFVAVFVFYSLSSASLGPTVGKWFGDSSGLAGIIIILPIVAFNLFLRYQMNREGTPGANRYGAPSGTAQANVF